LFFLQGWNETHTAGEKLFNFLELPARTVLFLDFYNDSAKVTIVGCKILSILLGDVMRRGRRTFMDGMGPAGSWCPLIGQGNGNGAMPFVKQNANVGLPVTQSDEKPSPRSFLSILL